MFSFPGLENPPDAQDIQSAIRLLREEDPENRVASMLEVFLQMAQQMSGE